MRRTDSPSEVLSFNKRINRLINGGFHNLFVYSNYNSYSPTPTQKKPNRSSTESTVLQILTLLEFFKFLRGDMKCLVLGKGLMVCKADNW